MKEKVIRFGGLLIAIIGVISYRELPQLWYLLSWIPISIGYYLFYGGSP